MIDLEARETPERALQSAATQLHIAFDITFELLEMLRPQIHAFGPDNLAAGGARVFQR